MAKDTQPGLGVAIVEDKDPIRRALSLLLDGTSGLHCAGAWPDAESMLEALEGCDPDVLLMDLGLPGMDGLEAIARVRAMRPEQVVLVLSVYDEDDKIFPALCAGACGYLLKSTPPAQLLEAIDDAHAGGSPMSAPIARRVVEQLRRDSPRGAREENILSPREREVLLGLADGDSYDQLGDHLGISVDTVRFHIRKVYRKLHVHSQSAAVAKALRRGWI